MNLDKLTVFLVRILIVVVILTLIALVIWLFWCHCQRVRPASVGETGERPVLHGRADSHKVNGGNFPPFTVREDDERNEDRAHPVPTGPRRGTLAPDRAGSKLLPIKKKKGDSPAGAGADPVVFTDYDPLGNTANLSGWPPDMTASRANNVVMLSYNTRVMLSTDGAATYTQIDPAAIFPSAPANDAAGNPLDKGLCCDQVIQYAPQIDRFIWLMQFCGTGSGCLAGINKIRIASASPQDIINSNGTAWTYWDFFSRDTFNLGTTTLDYPDMSIGDNSLYVSADAVGTGLLVVRIPLAQIANGGGISLDFNNPGLDGGVAYGGHVSQNTDNEVYWAGHINSSQMRVFSMREGEGVYRTHDVNVNSWPNGTIASTAADGTTDWLNFLGTSFPGNAILGLTRRGDEVWLAWTAAAGGGFSRAHVQVVQIDVRDYHLVSQWQIWNNDYAFAFPSLATNGNDEVGISLAWGGGAFNGNHAVGILGDFVLWYPELSTAAVTRWGDYVSVRRNAPQSLLYDASGYAIVPQAPPGTGTRADPYYIQFGRDSVVNGGSIIK
jgi:hypothetical protein